MRRCRHLLFKQLLNTLLLGVRCGGAVPLHQQLLALARGQQRQLTNALLRLGHNRFEQHFKVAHHPLDARPLKQVRVVFKREVELFRCFGREQREIKLRSLVFDSPSLERQSTCAKNFTRRILESKHHLKQRRATEVAFRLHRFHQLFKWQVLVGVGVKGRLADSGKQLFEGETAGERRLQGKSVNKKSDEILDLGRTASSDWSSNDNVFLSRVSEEQRFVSRENRHEERNAFAPAQFLQSLGGFLREFNRMPRAVECLDQRPRPIGWQIKNRRNTFQLFLPVRQLAVQQFLFQPFALPNSIVGVLNRQLGQKRWRLRRETFIKRRQFAYQDAQRPAVADDVMSGGKNYVFSFGEPHHFHAQQWTTLEVECFASFFVAEPLDLTLDIHYG